MTAKILHKNITNARKTIGSKKSTQPKETKLILSLAAINVIFLFTLSSPLLNIFMPYSTPGGNIFTKFHPASYVSFVILACIISTRRQNNPFEHHLVNALGFFTAIAAILAVFGKGALTSVVVDTQIAPTILLIALSRLHSGQQRQIMRIFTGTCAVNVFLVLIEFIRKKTLLPTDIPQEIYFRPVGLADHSIVAGTLFYIAIFIVTRGIYSSSVSRILQVLFIFGITLCGVRGPLLIGILIIISNILSPFIRRKYSTDYLFDIVLVIMIAIGGAAALALGAYDRIAAAGYWDDSTQSRVSIFNTISLLSNHEFWFGVDGYDVSDQLAKLTTGGHYIENAFVSFVLQAGFPLALIMAMAILFLHSKALISSKFFIAVFLTISLTTLGFGSKNMIPPALALLGFLITHPLSQRQKS